MLLTLIRNFFHVKSFFPFYNIFPHNLSSFDNILLRKMSWILFIYISYSSLFVSIILRYIFSIATISWFSSSQPHPRISRRSIIGTIPEFYWKRNFHSANRETREKRKPKTKTKISGRNGVTRKKNLENDSLCWIFSIFLLFLVFFIGVHGS